MALSAGCLQGNIKKYFNLTVNDPFGSIYHGCTAWSAE
jgi:hypothetical protein